MAVCGAFALFFNSKNGHNYLTFCTINDPLLCQISLMSILKANHNQTHKQLIKDLVVSNIVNVHFESKPQLVG